MLEITLRLIASLAIVVGLLLLLVKVSGKRFQGAPGAMVRVLHRQPLSRSSAISVVAVGDRVLVLGSTEHQVNVLTELDPDEVDLTVPSTPHRAEATSGALAGDVPATGTRPDFAAVLARVRGSEAADEGSPRRVGGSHRAARPSAASVNPRSGADRPARWDGSLLSPQTWRQAWTAVGRRAS